MLKIQFKLKCYEFLADLTPGITTALTPHSGAVVSAGAPGGTPTPGVTPLRDKLNINPEEGLTFDDNQNSKQIQVKVS